MALCLGLAACKAKDKSEVQEQQYAFRKDGVLKVFSPEGQLKAELDIEIAESDSKIMQGLKYRGEMERNQGMLFVFKNTDYRFFWMQDTYLSLDMLFIDYENKIVHIERDTEPFSEEQIFSEYPAQYVLEVLAGTADRFGIKEKDEVRWERD